MTDSWILIPRELVDRIEAADLEFGEKMVRTALEQYLTHLLRGRRYKERMRTDPATKDEWYRKKNEQCRKYRTKKIKAERFEEIRKRAEQ